MEIGPQNRRYRVCGGHATRLRNNGSANRCVSGARWKPDQPPLDQFRSPVGSALSGRQIDYGHRIAESARGLDTNRRIAAERDVSRTYGSGVLFVNGAVRPRAPLEESSGSEYDSGADSGYESEDPADLWNGE